MHPQDHRSLVFKTRAFADFANRPYLTYFYIIPYFFNFVNNFLFRRAIGLSPIGATVGFVCAQHYQQSFNYHCKRLNLLISLILCCFFIVSIFKKFSFWSVQYGIEPYPCANRAPCFPLHYIPNFCHTISHVVQTI